MVKRRTPEREVGFRDLHPPCCVLEQDTLLPESTGITEEVGWLRPELTERLMTGTSSLNTIKIQKKFSAITRPFNQILYKLLGTRK